MISFDDTINKKKEPSSSAKRPIKDGGVFFSHMDNKKVWGHNVVAATLSNEDFSLCYRLDLYRKSEAISKTEKVISMLRSLPDAEKLDHYALMDSWYPSEEVLKTAKEKKYYVISGLKKNRTIYKGKQKIQIAEFAQGDLSKKDFKLFPRGKNAYWVYRYQGKMSKAGTEDVIVLITYPQDAFGEEKALRAYLCTNTNLKTETILEYYGSRWLIEVAFKAFKTNFGFDKYQIRSSKGIENFWLILLVAEEYYKIKCNSRTLGGGIRIARERLREAELYNFKVNIEKGYEFGLCVNLCNL
jgi:hypothetical protein